jgi:hypothetical protein
VLNKASGAISGARPGEVGSVGDEPCSASVKRSFSEETETLADMLFMFRSSRMSSLPRSAGSVGVATLERLERSSMPFLPFFVNGVWSSTSSAPPGESLFPVEKKSPKLPAPLKIPPGTDEVMI